MALVSGMAADLVRLIGEPMALRLIELHGGARVAIATRPDPAHVLAQQLSPEAEAALVAAWPGAYIKVPLARMWRAAVYHQQGLTTRMIARRLGVYEEAVRVYLRTAELGEQQMELGL